ncbi:bifunctional phosphopantothenoylcysteine decarboxylase/phosphopantothenate--cysteine ligase CoaBC [Candidatus Neomarinimicrobiota bacterium]
MNFAGKQLLVAVCGSIAAYKSSDLIRALRRRGADVSVAMTEAATKFIGPATLSALASKPVLINQFPDQPAQGVPHVDIAENYDAIIVAPATADMLGKAAHAIADDLVSTLLNIADCPIIFAPAMNYRMWENPATQAAVEQLRSWGRVIIEPDVGELATFHVGAGRFPEIEVIVSTIEIALKLESKLYGRKVLISAGPTREPIDEVRFISNRSSGKMGYALAAAARDYGADVTLVSGPVALPEVQGCTTIKVETAIEMLKAVVDHVQDQDLLIMAAAVADFMPEGKTAGKIRRQSTLTAIPVMPAPDILSTIKDKFEGKLVAFSLQADTDRNTARNKLMDKGADYIVLNSYTEPGAGFDTETNHVWLLSASGDEIEIPIDSKFAIAKKILDHIVEDENNKKM